MFEREGAAISSIATVDIAIKYPVLYVALYAGACSPHEKGEFHWAFLIGPSNDRAESEGVRCGIDFQLDSNGRRSWSYNQTIVPLSRQPGLLVRMLLADIVDLRPLGEIIRDHDSTPTVERLGFMGEASEWTSLAWVGEKLEMLERKPECFAYKCDKFCNFERMGRRAAESLEKKWKENGVPPFAQFIKICMVSNWKPPDDDEVKVAVKLDLTRGRPNTISRAVQIVTGALGEDVLKTRQQLVERERQAIRAKQEVEERTRSKQSENATTLAKAWKSQGVDEGTKNAKNVEEQMTMARRERARNTTVDLPKLKKLTRACEENPVAKKEENGDQSEDDEDVDEATETAGTTGERGGTTRLESARVTTAVNLLEMNKPTRTPGRKPVAEEATERRDESNDEGDSIDEDDVEESEDEDDEDEEEDNENDEQEECKAKGSITQKKVIGRPDDVRKTATHFLAPNRAIEKKNAESQKDEDSSDNEDEDGEEEEEEEEEESEDSGNEDDDEDNDDKEDEDKEHGDEDSDSDNSKEDGSNEEEDEEPDKEDEEGEDSGDEDEEDEGDDEDDEKEDKDEDEDKDEEDEDEDDDEDKEDKDEDEDKDEGENDDEDDDDDDDDEEEDDDDDEEDDDDDEEEEEEMSAGPKTSEKDIPEISLSR